MSLVLTLSQAFRANAPEFDKNEFRITEAGLLNAFLKQTEGAASWVTDDLKNKAMLSAGNTVSIPVIDYKDVTIRSTRPLVIPADENVSKLITLTWTTLAYGFKMYPMQHKNNDISYQQDFDKKFRAMLVKLTSTIEALCNTAVNAAKTQVVGSGSDLPGGHTFSGDIVHETGIANLKESYIAGDIDPLMRLNDFMPFNMDVVGNQGLNAILHRMEGFAAQNAENKQWQWMSKQFGFSNAIANASGKKATGYAIADGSLGFLTRVEPDSEYRTKVDSRAEWDKIVLPGLGIEVGTYSYVNPVDANALHAGTSHLTRTTEQAFDFAVDIAIITPYNSAVATIPSPIIKFDVATA